MNTNALDAILGIGRKDWRKLLGEHLYVSALMGKPLKGLQ